MPQDYSVTNPGARGVEIKRRALVFAGVFLMGLLVLMALFELGPDPGITARQLTQRLCSTQTEIGLKQAPALFFLGVGAGLFGGMLGLGGGVLKVAGMLLLFKLDIFFARAVSLTTMFLTTASAAWLYSKRDFPIWQIIRPMLPLALVGVLGGLLLGNQLRGVTLTHIFGFFVLFLGLYTLSMVFDDPKEHVLRENFSKGQLDQPHGQLSASIGALHGFVCGLLGISGGVISVPMQQLLLNVPVHHAIANTLIVSALCSGLGSIIVVTTGIGQGAFSLEQILFAVLFIGAGAVLGAQIGVRISVKSSSVILRLLFVLISLVAGLSLLL